MEPLARAVRLAGHLLASALALGWFVLARRGGTLVFAHAPDVDASGRDAQMGPLVERLVARGERLVEVTFVPLSGGLLATLNRTRRLFVSHAALLAAGRVLGRERAGRLLLGLLAPRLVYLIDESGSGQTLLRAARALGIPTIGVQHGDFQPSNSRYSAPPAGTVAADVLALWSDWFRARLLAHSPLYDRANTRVVGRILPAPAPAGAGPGRRGTTTRVLLLSQREPGFPRRLAPFLEVLRSAPDFELVVRPHPGEDPARWPGSERANRDLAGDLAWADVVLGVESSALLEALRHGRPAVSLQTTPGEDPAGYLAAVATAACDRPDELAARCRSLASGDASGMRAARERVWSGGSADPVADLLALGEELLRR